MTANKFSLLLVATVLLGIVGTASADPLPNEPLKFQQLPMVATKILEDTYYGHDELSTAYRIPGVTQNLYQGTFMADDFADRVASPVVHVRWWGSYMNQPTHPGGVKDFLIAFETDVPADPTGGFSHPGDILLSQVVSLGPLAYHSGTFTETKIREADPLLGEALYEYNAELACPFPQQIDTVYWLKIVALVDPERDSMLQWGWHNRDYTINDPYASVPPPPPPGVIPGEHSEGFLPDGKEIWHFQDDAVSGTVFLNVMGQCDVLVDQGGYTPQNYVPPYDGPTLIFNHSKDLAFELYAPEPSSIALLGMGAVALVVVYRRKRAG